MRHYYSIPAGFSFACEYTLRDAKRTAREHNQPGTCWFEKIDAKTNQRLARYSFNGRKWRS
jgi:rubredoxin